MQFRTYRNSSLWAALALVCVGTVAQAQAWNYPSFQTPRVTTREFNFGIADGGQPAGNTFVFQWREGRTPRMQLSLDLGITETDFGSPAADDTYLLAGVQLGRQLAVSRPDMPFDILFTAGAFAAFGDGGPFLTLPFGTSLGRRFMLDGGLALTPYVHPRLAVDYCGECDRGDGNLDLALVIDLGFSFDVNPNVAFRFSGSFADEDDRLYRSSDAIGVSLAWTTGFVRR